MITKHLTLVLLCVLTTFSFAEADNSPNYAEPVHAIRCTDPIVVDGNLTESTWQQAKATTRFIQRDPVENGTPSEPTEVKIVYNDEALYVGARMYDSSPDSIVARLGRRDANLSSDYFIVFLDSYYDRRSGFYFALNAAGALSDGVMMNDDWDDNSWDGVWEGRARIDDKGWIAEMRIPFSQLRFQEKSRHVWGVNFKRVIERKNEMDYLTFTPKDGSGFVSRFADLVGIESIVPPRHFEALPYLRSKAEFLHVDKEDPFHDGAGFDPGIGLDLKFGLGPNLTVDATFNPDFGQVEVDPAVVNLSDFETYYQEKRPFFIEGASIFNFGQGGARNYWGFNWSNPKFFYSRRIGRAPAGSLPDNDYADVPDGTKILGAAKLSGKINENWNIGMIHAVTSKETADIRYDGNDSRVDVEPLTYYGVFRGQREFAKGRQGLGVIGTLTARKFRDSPLMNEMNRNASTMGLDGWTFLDKDKEWVIAGWVGGSHIEGTQAQIADLQNSSQHYFQRPDLSQVHVDSSRTSLTGYAGRIYLNKQKGSVFVNSAFGFISPSFNSNDAGFMWQTDLINWHAGAGYQWTKPNLFYRYMYIIGAVFQSYDFGGHKISNGYFSESQITFKNYYNMFIMGIYNPRAYSSRGTRGGPLMLNGAGMYGYTNIQTDNRKSVVFEVDGDVFSGEFGERDRSVGLEVEWKPAANVSVSIEPEISASRNIAQWVDNFEDASAKLTYDHRYVFAHMEQRTFSSDIRLSWTFTPRLSLQLFAQPLISSGDYSEFKALARPAIYEFDVFGKNGSTITYEDETYTVDPDGNGPAESFSFDDPDFNFKSLRGNAVLRWEYSPGSAIYLVWTQSREESEVIGNMQFQRSMRKLFSADVNNIFMVKWTYWWNL
ncbi:carbohydrate binding family 9 domain-containing protein [candidate division KSB1 bacterium]|nr:carbohydrate binding family 9 domain-containing protein [candidate division KSB1 bacterium]